MPQILVIEDDAAIVRGLTDALEEEFFTVTSKRDGLEGLIAGREGKNDCILIDVMLPGMNGREICKILRSEGITTPIIMLTSRSEETDIILGLEFGADDYLTKPFSIRELIARIRALLRRTTKPSVKTLEVDELIFEDVHIDFNRRQATFHEKTIRLSAKEFDILHYFRDHEGEVITREMLLNAIWGYEHFPTTRTVDNYILALRKKLENNPSKPKHILTLHTIGYKFLIGE
jgi:DNA-binding response OmpR family regulator